jgi:ribosomal protein S18 acetylase RimI-like enzyme
MIKIIPVETESLIHHTITLSQEYVTWMLATIRQELPDLDTTEFAAGHNYDDVRKKFPGEHVPPFGRLYLAMNDEEVSGCIALAKLSESVCEMRTLYVRPAYRGMGIGKKLVDTILNDAREIGYSHMRLDTLPFMQSALNMYHSLGFQDRAPYGNVSDSLKPYICFLELDLRL